MHAIFGRFYPFFHTFLIYRIAGKFGALASTSENRNIGGF
jgi:hypothetical protein